MKVKVAQLCLTLCDPTDYTVHGILQARTMDCAAFPFSRGSSQSRNQTSCTTGRFFTSWATREALCNTSCIHLFCIFTLLYIWVPPSKALVCLFTSATSTTFQHILTVTLRFCWTNEKRALAFLLLIFLTYVTLSLPLVFTIPHVDFS